MVTLKLQFLRDCGKLLHYYQMLRCYTAAGSREENIAYICCFIILSRHGHVSVWLHETCALELQWLRESGKLWRLFTIVSANQMLVTIVTLVTQRLLLDKY